MLIRILTYFVPFAINFLSGGFFFISAYRFSQAGCSGAVVGGSVAAWGAAYCLLTTVIGRFVNAANALRWILTGGLCLMATSLGFIIFDTLYLQYLWMVTAGFGAALFCTPFQLFAKSIESGSKKEVSGTVTATSFYTLTWSVGFATGPLAFARLSVKQGFLVTLLLATLVTVSVLLIALICKKSEKSVEAEENVATVPEKRRFTMSTYTKLAVLGWIVGGLGTTTVCQIRTMWPKLGNELALPMEHIIYITAIVSYVQGLTALALCRGKEWMFRRIPALLMSVCGVSGLLIFTFAHSLMYFYAAAVLCGIYAGCLYFYLVYHSLAHPRNSFFVAANEVIVGVVSLAATMIGGVFADIFNFTGAAFIFAVVMIVVAFTAQMIVLAPGNLQEEV